MKYCFNDYELCTDTRELRYKNKLKKIEPLIFNILIFMLENQDRVLSRDELIQNIWSGRVISDSALSAAICAARNAIGDSGHKQNYIKTISGTGYRFIGVFTTTNDKSATKDCLLPTTKYSLNNSRSQTQNKIDISTTISVDNYQLKSRELPDKPSIAVMDFIDLGNQQGGKILASGLTSEINSTLSRLPHLFVIARASSASLAKLGLSAKEAGLRLGVRYLVYATTQYISRRMRIIISLVDATKDIEIWSEHYDRSIDDLFVVQDDIVKEITSAIVSIIEQSEIERAFLISTENLSAWENYHRGLHYINQTTRKGVNTARYYFKQALLNDIKFARANAGLAYTYTSCKLLNDSFSTKNDIQKALKYGQLSIDCSKRDTMGYMSLGRTFYFMQKYRKSLMLIKQGLQLNPVDIHCIYFRAFCASVLGQNKDAQFYFDFAEQLSPLDPLLFSIKMIRAISLVQEKKYSEAADLSQIATNCPNAYFMNYAIAAICLQLDGQIEQAQCYANKVLALKPDFSLELFNILSTHIRGSEKSRFIQALRNTGIPEKSLMA